MIISKEELNKYHEARPDEDTGLPWMDVNTDNAKTISDEKLLGLISQTPMVRGWGLIAELCKRFNEK